MPASARPAHTLAEMLQALFGQQPDSVLAIGAESFDRFYLLTLRRLALKHVPESGGCPDFR